MGALTLLLQTKLQDVVNICCTTNVLRSKNHGYALTGLIIFIDYIIYCIPKINVFTRNYGKYKVNMFEYNMVDVDKHSSIVFLVLHHVL